MGPFIRVSLYHWASRHNLMEDSCSELNCILHANYSKLLLGGELFVVMVVVVVVVVVVAGGS